MGFWQEYGDTEEKIQRVRKIIIDQVKGVRGPAGEVIDYILNTEGKYLRAGFTILSAEMGGCVDDRPYRAAAALEMLHMATLVHDDIIDEAKMRRGSSSVQGKFGKDVAVYTGDFLLARAYRFMAESWREFSIDKEERDEAENWEQVIWFSRGIESICKGEMNQNMLRGSRKISYRDYIRIITGKTAVLFAICGNAGALISGMAKQHRKALVNSLRDMGVAFQIRDDCRDYMADESRLGKEPLNDLRQGIFTLPLIFAMKREPRLYKMLDGREPGNAEREFILKAIRETGSMDKALQIGERYLKKALENLEILGDGKEVQIMRKVYLRLGEGLQRENIK